MLRSVLVVCLWLVGTSHATTCLAPRLPPTLVHQCPSDPCPSCAEVEAQLLALHRTSLEVDRLLAELFKNELGLCAQRQLPSPAPLLTSGLALAAVLRHHSSVVPT